MTKADLDALLARVLAHPRPEPTPEERAAEEHARWLDTASQIGVPPCLREASLDGAQETAALQCIRRYLAADLPWGRALILLGGVGVGKSWAAVAALRAAPDLGLRRLFLHVPGVASDYLDPERRVGARKRALETRFVVLDDLGAEYGKGGGLFEAFLDEVVWVRHAHRLPTIVTANLTTEQLRTRLTDRAVDRCREWARVHELPGESLRRVD